MALLLTCLANKYTQRKQEPLYADLVENLPLCQFDVNVSNTFFSPFCFYLYFSPLSEILLIYNRYYVTDLGR